MLAKEVLQNIDNNCNCQVEELPNQVKNTEVKSYGLTIECDVCKAKREAQNIISGKQRRKQEILTELNQLDLKIIRPLSEGETVKVQELVNQKIALREELATL